MRDQQLLRLARPRHDLPIVVANYCSPPAARVDQRAPFRVLPQPRLRVQHLRRQWRGLCRHLPQGYQPTAQRRAVQPTNSHCRSGACKDWPGAGIANERYCLGEEQDICANTERRRGAHSQGLDSSPNQHATNLGGNNDHDQYNCRDDYYCSADRRLHRPAMGSCAVSWRATVAARVTCRARIRVAIRRTAPAATATAAPALRWAA